MTPLQWSDGFYQSGFNEDLQVCVCVCAFVRVCICVCVGVGVYVHVRITISLPSPNPIPLFSTSPQPNYPKPWLAAVGYSSTSHVTRHTSHVTRHTSHVTRQTHTSHVTRHTSHRLVTQTDHAVQYQTHLDVLRVTCGITHIHQPHPR